MAQENRGTDEAHARPVEGQKPPGDERDRLGRTSTGLDPRLAAFLSYVLSIFLSFISGLIFYFTERENKFVRFHALQSVFFNLAVIVISIALTAVTGILSFVPILGWIAGATLWVIFGIGAFVVWVVLMAKSAQGEYYKLPYLGDWADQNS